MAVMVTEKAVPAVWGEEMVANSKLLTPAGFTAKLPDAEEIPFAVAVILSEAAAFVMLTVGWMIPLDQPPAEIVVSVPVSSVNVKA